MPLVLLAVVPIFLVIAAGWLARRKSFPGDGFWAPAERLTYFVLFPALLVETIAKADFSMLDVLPMGSVIVAGLALMTLALVIARPLLGRTIGMSGPAFTSLYQGATRMNTYIGLSIALAVHGRLGLAAAAVAVGAITPLVNVVSVALLLRYGAFGRTLKPAGLALALVRNPLIVACVVGALLNWSGLGLPPVADTVLEIVSRAALPLGLLTVGAALVFDVRRSNAVAIGLGAVLKLLLLPAVVLGLALMMGLQGASLFVAVLFTALPTAATSYVLARQLGGDAPLMAAMTTAQTLLSLVTLPLVLTWVA